MSKDPSSSDLSRGDFLKVAGLSGLVPSLGSVMPTSAAENGAERLYVVTHSDDDLDRAALGWFLGYQSCDVVERVSYQRSRQIPGGLMILPKGFAVTLRY
jgi:hypothetical protein